MRTTLKIVGMMTLVAGLGLGGDVLANCQGEGPYEVIQCGQQTWFAVPPAGSGAVTAQWWQLGFGNATNAVDPTGSLGIDGSGFYYDAVVNYSTTWVGNDSGAAQLDIRDASFIGGPPGSLCFSSAANWAAPGVDGCSDNDRLALTVPGVGINQSDAFLNRYWAGATAGTLRYSNQVDSPMATLLKESNGLNFALAFFATTSRGQSATDIASGGFSMNALSNGDPNPVTSRNDVVPWQPVPQPSISADFVNPADKLNSARILAVSWTPIRLVHDGTTRKCRNAANTADCSTLGTLAGSAVGVGVLDQGPLAHYVLEQTPYASGACGTAWTAVGNMVNDPASSTSATVAPNTCVRLKTMFGRTPQVNYVQSVLDGAATAAMWDGAVRGKLGDVGYHVVSRTTVIGGSAVSQKATLTVVEKNKNALTVKWETSSELNVTGFDIVGIDNKGGKQVIGTAACKSCTTGLSESYTQVIAAGQSKGYKKVQVVMQPSGEGSNVLDLK